MEGGPDTSQEGGEASLRHSRARRREEKMGKADTVQTDDTTAKAQMAREQLRNSALRSNHCEIQGGLRYSAPHP